MRLSWNEIKRRAATFAQEWAGQGYEKGSTQLFYREFFDVFGVPVRRVATFEEPVKQLAEGKRGFIDLFWRGVLMVEQKSMGRSLNKAKTQALSYFDGLKNADLPRYLLVSDFQSFELYDLDEDREVKFTLQELPKHVEKFGFILGVQTRTFKDQDPVNIEAAELVGTIHDGLAKSGYTGDALQQFLVRLVFCLFADDTGIFEPRDIFMDLVENRTSEDGSDLGPRLSELFQVLDTPESSRQRTLDEDLARFPYVNGELFSAPLRIPAFDAKMRQSLLDACRFDWSNISPAIFGSLFQSVLDGKERRTQGAHYTTEANILKVIQPLFLDGLREEFERLRARKDSRRKGELERFQQRLGTLRFFDPACGCGNFLIIAYRELRQLEQEVIHELRTSGTEGAMLSGEQLVQDIASVSCVTVDQFYGIELGAFPARIAETALWMMDHIMNVRLSVEVGQHVVRIPLTNAPHIKQGDALEMEWASLLPREEVSYVMGNPPFIGSKYQSPEQRKQVQRIANLGGSGGSLDYVAAWFIKAAEYVKGTRIGCGFVSTNSISQGEQVGQLWPLMFERYGMDITFAHRTFAWGSDARGVAHVHVVVVGFADRTAAPTVRRLFSYASLRGVPFESGHSAISPYLLDASKLSHPNLVVREATAPLHSLPRMVIGSKPIDGGHLVFSADERSAFLSREPGATALMRPYIGSREFINGQERFILYLRDVSPSELRALPLVRERIAQVRAFRQDSSDAGTRKLAEVPTRFHVDVVPKGKFLVVPETSSERREYVPIGWLEAPVIPSNLVRVVEDASLEHFALLTSAIHMSWLRHVGGRLKSDYRYGIGNVYNTFPIPMLSESDQRNLFAVGQGVLDARAAHPEASLADLYDPDTMPPDLRKAHNALDKAVDRIYRKEPFTSDRERAEHLLSLYETMVQPLALDVPAKRKRVAKAK